jgi:hypothetical protein
LQFLKPAILILPIGMLLLTLKIIDIDFFYF